MLILVDGIEFNEQSFGTLQFGSHISADLIDKIEIIRGPGSAMYGGTAELAVIKITSKGANTQGAWIQATPSVNNGHFNQKYDAILGNTYKDIDYSVSASFKKGTRSNEMLPDKNQEYDMSRFSDFADMPLYVNASLNTKGLDVRFIQDNYSYDLRDYYQIVTQARKETFDSTLASVKYDWKATDTLTLSPKFTYKRHDAWQHFIDGAPRWNVRAERLIYDLVANQKFNDKNLLTFGSQYFMDYGTAREQSANPKATHWAALGGTDVVTIDNVAAFAQYEANTDIGNFTVGLRYEDHEVVGDGWAPRAAYTKAWENWHIKALYNQAFRTPSLEVIRYNYDNSSNAISKEETTGYEFEVGRKNWEKSHHDRQYISHYIR